MTIMLGVTIGIAVILLFVVLPLVASNGDNKEWDDWDGEDDDY